MSTLRSNLGVFQGTEESHQSPGKKGLVLAAVTSKRSFCRSLTRNYFTAPRKSCLTLLVVARRTFFRRWLVKEDLPSVQLAEQRMALAAGYGLVRSFQRKRCPLFVIESGWPPPQGIVTRVTTRRAPLFWKLPGMRVFVAPFATHGRFLEVNILQRGLQILRKVAGAANHRAMRAQQRKRRR